MKINRPAEYRARAVLFLSMAAFMLAWQASAQTTIEAPAPRFISPGDYVTLVFVVHPSASGIARLTFTVPKGWQLLGGRNSTQVTSGTALPLAITVAVPPGAQPNTSDSVELSVKLQGATVTESVGLNVLPQPSVTLEVPAEVPIDAGKVTGVITNTGNVALHLTATFMQGPKSLSQRAVDIAAQQKKNVVFQVLKGGSYSIEVQGMGNIDVSRSVTVLAYGVPVPPPFQIRTQVSGAVSSDSTWGLELTGQGPLSDYARLSTYASAVSPRTSFAQVQGQDFGVRIGSGSAPRFGLDLPTTLGVTADLGGAAWDAFGGAGQVLSNEWAGYVGGAWIGQEKHLVLAAAGGMGSGTPLASFAVTKTSKQRRMAATVTWSGGALAASASADAVAQGERLHVEANAGLDAMGAPEAGAYVRYRSGSTVLAAAGTINPATTAVDSAYAGFQVALPSIGLGSLQLSSQAGLDGSFVMLEQSGQVTSWRESNELGIRWDQGGPSVTASTSWQLPGTDYVGVNGDLQIGLDDAVVSAGVGARAQVSLGSFLLFGGAQLDGIGQSASLRAGAQWRAGALGLQLSGTVGSPYDNFGSDLAASIQLRGTYAFAVDVPNPIADLAGGRDEGILEGRVSGASDLPGIVVDVGSYRLRVGKNGHFHASLRPGTYSVRLDAKTVPIAYRITTPASQTIKIVAKKTTHATFRIARGAGVTGTVLLDSHGIGKPDSPPVGVQATVSLVDAKGLVHMSQTSSDGTFVFRGLPAGEARVTVSGLPLGDEVEGEPQQALTVEAGKVTSATILVRPATATARTFGGAGLHIRSIEVQAQRVPPGASPLVVVKLSSNADKVLLTSGSQSVDFEGAGTSWAARLPIPKNARPGLYRFTVAAEHGTTRVERSGQAIVDPSVPLLKGKAAGAGHPGRTLKVTATVLAKASRVLISSAASVGIDGHLDETDPGTWNGTLSVPADIAPGRYILTATAFAGQSELGKTTFAIGVLKPVTGPH